MPNAFDEPGAVASEKARADSIYVSYVPIPAAAVRSNRRSTPVVVTPGLGAPPSAIEIELATERM